MKQSMVVVNKGGGAGAEGFLDVKGAKGDRTRSSSRSPTSSRRRWPLAFRSHWTTGSRPMRIWRDSRPELNGTPVAIGVVKRLESVMMILCGRPCALHVQEALGARAAALFTTTIDCFIRLCLAMIDCVSRAIWSAPRRCPRAR